MVMCPNCGNNRSAVVYDDGVEVHYASLDADAAGNKVVAGWCRKCRNHFRIVKPVDAAPLLHDNILWAYRAMPKNGMELKPAALERDWMDAATQRAPYRCLPLAVANRSGWIVTCPTSFQACWAGGADQDDLTFTNSADVGSGDARVKSLFGNGIITFDLPYLFRTPPGINLMIMPPPNMVRDGVQGLTGIVETDWNVATFTMNWKMTRPYFPVQFHAGEAICMLMPLSRSLISQLEPRETPLANNPALAEQHRVWSESRHDFVVRLHGGDRAAAEAKWQRNYFLGESPGGASAADVGASHQTKIALKPFEEIK